MLRRSRRKKSNRELQIEEIPRTNWSHHASFHRGKSTSYLVSFWCASILITEIRTNPFASIHNILTPSSCADRAIINTTSSGGPGPYPGRFFKAHTPRLIQPTITQLPPRFFSSDVSFRAELRCSAQRRPSSGARNLPEDEEEHLDRNARRVHGWDQHEQGLRFSCHFWIARRPSLILGRQGG